MSRFSSDVQGSSAIAVVDPRPRTARALRLGERAGAATLQAAEHLPLAQSEDLSAARTEASIRSEKAASMYLATRDQRRSVQARVATARAFDEALHERQVRGEEAYSNVAIARACDVDERIVRDWRDDSPDGKRAVPLWTLRVLPFEIHRELVTDIDAARIGKVDPLVLPNVRPMLSKLAAQLAQYDANVALRELVATRGMVDGMIDRLAKGKGG